MEKIGEMNSMDNLAGDSARKKRWKSENTREFIREKRTPKKIGY